MSGPTELRPPPDVFAVVMAAGIVSIAALDHTHRWVSAGLALFAAGALPVLMVLAAHGWRHRALDLADVDVVLRLFTFVAAGAVLATRFGGSWVVWPLAAMALSAWMSLLPVLLRRMRRVGWPGLRDRARGAWELASVGTSALAIVFADLRMMFPALLFWVLALLIYGFMTALILLRTGHERLDREGFQPDSWILMGALAIATVAGVHIHAQWPTEVVQHATVVTWLVATLWIPALMLFAVRGVRTQVPVPSAWWAMVFPLGMYSSATFALWKEVGWGWLHPVSQAFFWTALAAWLTVAALWGFRRVLTR
ncbi:tellurite resistance/C4-dicarboxylate transporter family protein [[Mycobacterium] burgundiense]|uniref:Tellurite resistance/C4-dicarboxylate transporter family protein n=1 Tax=[Mycobacterium] burgundiense TaxID=3064286 RepID=A0ABM9LBJ6_9MYCO|nr:tellurite resistance/C4-dicarboxylate transporter family protein [Mycolicibacterium sp. MU0053]CAJ1496217.1 tellurite resistance/C4-dicarboxylate transporter family protein [Mycolicibacterium sp. MU0053]